jgi:hypothetical protein
MESVYISPFSTDPKVTDIKRGDLERPCRLEHQFKNALCLPPLFRNRIMQLSTRNVWTCQKTKRSRVASDLETMPEL